MPSLLDALLRQQVYIEGVKAQQLIALQPVLAELNRDIRRLLLGLSYDSMDGLSKTALNDLLRELKRLATKRYNGYVNSLVIFLQDFMRVDRRLTIDIYETFVPEDERGRIPSGSEDDRYPAVPFLWSRMKNAPMPANGIFPLDFIATLTGAGTLAILNRVRQGYANREDVRDILLAISGSRDANYTNGILHRSTNNARAIISTTVQNISAINDDAIGRILFSEYDWVSVIDSATTPICRTRNGNRYRYGHGPMPPAHAGCRSTAVPVVKGQPKRPAGFKSWANAQPATVRRDMFGASPVGEHFDGSRPLTIGQYAAKKDWILGEG